MQILHTKGVKNDIQEKRFAHAFSLLLIFISCLCIPLQLPPVVFAQGRDSIIIQDPDTSNFPEIVVPFQFTTSQETWRSDLEVSDLLVSEDGNPVQIEALTKKRSGIHFTLAVNPSSQLDIRDADGVSPYEKLREALVDWADTRSTVVGDRWSFVSTTGVEVSNINDRQAWIGSLIAYQPNFRLMEQQLSSLETAIIKASERVVAFGVDKVLLYITPVPLPDQLDAITDLTSQAIDAGIQVNVWMVDDPYYLTNDQGGVLMDLANTTGGSFYNFTGSEVIPDPETYLAGLGTYYTVSYQSGIRETGTFTLQFTITTPDGEVTGESPSFYMEVKPPNPILISPPAVISRKPAEGQAEQLLPSNQSIEILVEFPDCNPRPIVASRLYVDGKVVDERETLPFDVFDWDLSELINSGNHTIQVEVEDSLGLSAKTILTPVEIEVRLPEPEEGLNSRQIGIILFFILLIISVVAFISWLSRRYWQSDSLKSLLPGRFGEGKSSGMLASKSINEMNKVHASLSPLGSQIDQMDAVINLTKYRVNIGRDPLRANLVLEDPSVEELHALLLQNDGEFWLNDMGSTSGTWVNYARIGKQPVRIQPGDILHFGSSGYRFIISSSTNASKVTISKYEPFL